jgi:hypothetical protein
MDTLLVPLELLCTVSQLDFPDRKSYLRWEKRQVDMRALQFTLIHLLFCFNLLAAFYMGKVG